jgi:hypothetical protein
MNVDKNYVRNYLFQKELCIFEFHLVMLTGFNWFRPFLQELKQTLVIYSLAYVELFHRDIF